jgi:acyl-CoA synthetase (NDP forming)
MRALAAWQASHDRLRMREAAVPPTPPAIRATATKTLRAAPRPVLTEGAAKALLAPYGIPVVGEALVQDAAAAIRAATTLGFPVALKVESPDIPHKTEAGVIRLGLRDAAQLEDAFAAVTAAARTVTSNITGVLVQPMAKPGVEMLMGARIDPAFGPLVAFGLGGVMVELLKDTALLPAPFGAPEAEAALRRLRFAPLLHGFRGSPAVSLPALGKILSRFSRFVADHVDDIAEIDVNPLICAGEDIVAVDALIIRRAAG